MLNKRYSMQYFEETVEGMEKETMAREAGLKYVRSQAETVYTERDEGYKKVLEERRKLYENIKKEVRGSLEVNQSESSPEVDTRATRKSTRAQKAVDKLGAYR